MVQSQEDRRHKVRWLAEGRGGTPHKSNDTQPTEPKAACKGYTIPSLSFQTVSSASTALRFTLRTTEKSTSLVSFRPSGISGTVNASL